MGGSKSRPEEALLTLALALAHEPVQDAFPELADCMAAGNDTQLAINLCSARGSRVQAAREAMYLERLGWMGDEGMFDAAQKTWKTFLKARCDHLGSAWEGGSGQPMIIHGCQSGSIGERANHLAALAARTSKAPASLAEADKALNDTWKKHASGNKALLAVQRTWLAYRDAQCAWEESREKGSRDRCLAMLTANRTQELVGDAAEP